MNLQINSDGLKQIVENIENRVIRSGNNAALTASGHYTGANNFNNNLKITSNFARKFEICQSSLANTNYSPTKNLLNSASFNSIESVSSLKTKNKLKSSYDFYKR